MHLTLPRSLLMLSALVILASHPTSLVAEQASGAAEILAQIQKIPHDPSALGTLPARARLKEYEAPFQLREYQSLDGTRLAAATALHQDGKPHPGVVLAHGFTETKNQKYIVELSALLHRNGWHVLAIDLRGHGESRKLRRRPLRSAGRRRTISWPRPGCCGVRRSRRPSPRWVSTWAAAAS
jgi:predicted alpha/beta-fold hydrolase